MGSAFPYLDYKEVYDLVLLDTEEYLILKEPLKGRLQKLAEERYTRVLFLSDLLDDSRLFSRLARGTSVVRKRSFIESIGFEQKVILTYSLERLQHTKKTQFGYALRGRNPGEGLQKEFNAKMIGRNAMILPFQNLANVEEFLSSWGVTYDHFVVYEENRMTASTSNKKGDNQQKRDKK